MEFFDFDEAAELLQEFNNHLPENVEHLTLKHLEQIKDYDYIFTFAKEQEDDIFTFDQIRVSNKFT